MQEVTAISSVVGSEGFIPNRTFQFSADPSLKLGTVKNNYIRREFVENDEFDTSSIKKVGSGNLKSFGSASTTLVIG